MWARCRSVCPRPIVCMAERQMVLPTAGFRDERAASARCVPTGPEGIWPLDLSAGSARAQRNWVCGSSAILDAILCFVISVDRTNIFPCSFVCGEYCMRLNDNVSVDIVYCIYISKQNSKQNFMLHLRTTRMQNLHLHSHCW